MSTRMAVDVGGTWLRIRVGDSAVLRHPAPSRIHHPHREPDELVAALVTTLAEHAPPDATVDVSCGAALDEELGIAYGSGPLWGGMLPTRLPLRALLEQARPDVTWNLVNDVTAALADAVRRLAAPTDRRVAYLTVSSGIALRTADLTASVIDVDTYGLQGEVGHLRAATSAPEAVRSLECLCGGTGHIAALCAGPAIPRVAAALGLPEPAAVAAQLSARVAAGDPDARTLLRTIVEPIAELVRTLRTTDPLLDLVVLGGGVAEGLADVYETELTAQLAEVRSYADAGPAELRVRVCRPGYIDPLTGATAVAVGRLPVRKGRFR